MLFFTDIFTTISVRKTFFSDRKLKMTYPKVGYLVVKTDKNYATDTPRKYYRLLTM